MKSQPAGHRVPPEVRKYIWEYMATDNITNVRITSNGSDILGQDQYRNLLSYINNETKIFIDSIPRFNLLIRSSDHPLYRGYLKIKVTDTLLIENIEILYEEVIKRRDQSSWISRLEGIKTLAFSPLQLRLGKLEACVPFLARLRSLEKIILVSRITKQKDQGTLTAWRCGMHIFGTPPEQTGLGKVYTSPFDVGYFENRRFEWGSTVTAPMDAYTLDGYTRNLAKTLSRAYENFALKEGKKSAEEIKWHGQIPDIVVRTVKVGLILLT
ncbi:hypothetical protein B0O99DRAFT_683415 [Bisporella sp. PMI_857]|nr:hypothetical protein B0O99DRAFT_683415 [Bisporella sp. PMI_857]